MESQERDLIVLVLGNRRGEGQRHNKGGFLIKWLYLFQYGDNPINVWHFQSPTLQRGITMLPWDVSDWGSSSLTTWMSIRLETLKLKCVINIVVKIKFINISQEKYVFKYILKESFAVFLLTTHLWRFKVICIFPQLLSKYPWRIKMGQVLLPVYSGWARGN